MTDPVTHATFHLERVYDASPERVWQALSDPEARRRWFMEGDGGFTTVAYEPDFRVGAREYFRFTVDELGRDMTNTAHFYDIVENRRIVNAYSMGFIDEPPFSVSLSTFELIPEGGRTRLRFTEQGAFLNRDADHAAMREEGWKLILELLAKEIDRQTDKPEEQRS